MKIRKRNSKSQSINTETKKISVKIRLFAFFQDLLINKESVLDPDHLFCSGSNMSIMSNEKNRFPLVFIEILKKIQNFFSCF